MRFKTYLVGGAVRDELMGEKSKDLDFVMLAPTFDDMREAVIAEGCAIFVETPKYRTIRANHPKFGPVDFAMARKDGSYTDGRHPNDTETTMDLREDLSRRDFTCNAIAKDIETGELVDPFDGQWAIEERALISVGSPEARFAEDRLRVFRALRFTVVKNFRMHCEIASAIGRLTPGVFAPVSTERIREELLKMFLVDPARSMRLLTNDFPVLWDVVRARGIWFKPTTAEK